MLNVNIMNIKVHTLVTTLVRRDEAPPTALPRPETGPLQRNLEIYISLALHFVLWSTLLATEPINYH